ncbi:PASTA domain-containing protein [Micromonospora auratinigra]|uniref:PASTA domain-containing protein n=1 Tax=Micromonospora auratinigra TaxID=261654 RepID=A0A1A9A1A6_9ACTN|nr:PASTA domain-containing protein [Micromonospora auratinigra]SBT49927.1 PASTA domain-containing protein [Micromonospora auratinigra]
MSDDRQEPPPEDADATRPLPRTDRGPAGPEESGAATRGGPAATAPLPPTPAAWSGRAGVPVRPAGGQEPEWYADEQSGRRWWMPILLGILALALVALIGLGVWLLALRAVDRGPGPLPSPSAVPSTAPPTSAAPTTTAPSPSPSTTSPSPTPSEVAMPPLVGLPEAAARAILDRLDVDYRVRTRASDRPAGTVIETDPAAGEPLRDGDRVTLVVAEPAAPTTGAGTPTSAPTATATP